MLQLHSTIDRKKNNCQMKSIGEIVNEIGIVEINIQILTGQLRELKKRKKTLLEYYVDKDISNENGSRTNNEQSELQT